MSAVEFTALGLRDLDCEQMFGYVAAAAPSDECWLVCGGSNDLSRCRQL